MTQIDIIEDYRQASDFLAAVDADWQRLIQTVGPCTHQLRPEQEPYEALIRAVAYQQLHGRAAEAILARLLQLYAGAFPSPQELLQTDAGDIRACGFSGRKIATLQAIAQGVLDGIVPDRAQAALMNNDELISRLVTLKGIGRWTVEMLLISTLGRMDVLPVDDLGVRNGYQLLKSLEQAPSPKALAILGLAWSPYRTVAAWYLWRVPRDKSQATG